VADPYRQFQAAWLPRKVALAFKRVIELHTPRG